MILLVVFYSFNRLLWYACYLTPHERIRAVAHSSIRGASGALQRGESGAAAGHAILLVEYGTPAGFIEFKYLLNYQCIDSLNYFFSLNLDN